MARGMGFEDNRRPERARIPRTKSEGERRIPLSETTSLGSSSGSENPAPEPWNLLIATPGR